MRILYALTAERFGGAERQGLLHIRGLAGLGHEVVPVVGPGRIICRALEEQGTSDYVYLSNMVHEHSAPITELGRLRRKVGALRSWLQLQGRLRRLMVDRGIEVVVANRPFAWTTVSRAARGLGLPLIWRGGSRVTELQHVVGLRALSALWPPDLLLCNCEAVRRSLAPHLTSPTAILRNGVDTRRFDPDRVEPRFRSDADLRRPVVGFAGRLHPEKGPELLAEVLRRTARRVPGVQLLVAGEHGWRAEFESGFDRRRLNGRVRFLGHVDRVEEFYRSCDVVILCSRERSIEGSPNAMLEAMAMARPVVATGVGGVSETLRHGLHGFVAGDSDAAGLTHHLVELLRDPELRRRQGAAGRATILTRHDSRRVVAHLAGFLRRPSADAAPARPLAPRLAPGPG